MGKQLPGADYSAARIIEGWLDGARRIPSPNFEPRPDTPVDLLVIHSISLPPGRFGGCHIDELFLNCLDPRGHSYFTEIYQLRVSCHLLIDRHGCVSQYVDLRDRAWHAGQSSFCGRDNCNDYSVGVELEGSDDQPFTDRQYQVLSEVTASIRRYYPAIAADRIVGHSDIAPGRKTDPGPLFDWDRYLSSLGQQGV